MKFEKEVYEKKITELKEAYPEAWRNAHSGNEKTEDFVYIVAYELHKIDPAIGLNGKRGDPKDISDDALSVKDETGFDYDPTDHNAPRRVIDFIGAAGDPDKAKVQWGTAIAADGKPTGSAWVKPTKPGSKPKKEESKPAPAFKLKDRETFYKEITELNDFYASFDGLKRYGGMVINEKADVQAMGAWCYNLLAENWTVEQAKAAIRESFEWKAKH